MLLTDTFSGTEPPTHGLGVENSTYHQVNPDGTLRIWVKKNGAWNIEGRVGSDPSVASIHIATATLTDAQIRALPITAVVLVPATEVLGYVGFPSSIFKVIGGVALLDATAGAYTNVGDGGAIRLVIGSDSSMTAAYAGTFGGDVALTYGNLAISFEHLSSSAAKAAYSFVVAQGTIGPGALQDNAIAINAFNVAANDPGTDLGVFTQGNAANTMRVKIYYTIEDLS